MRNTQSDPTERRRAHEGPSVNTRLAWQSFTQTLQNGEMCVFPGGGAEPASPGGGRFILAAMARAISSGFRPPPISRHAIVS